MQEQYDGLPPLYSQELQNLITTMLLKEDQRRPTTLEIIGTPLVQRYLTAFVQTNGGALKTSRAFERQATATAQLQGLIGPARRPEEKKDKHRTEQPEKVLSAKEQMARRKEEQAKKRAEELAQAAKSASQQMAE